MRVSIKLLLLCFILISLLSFISNSKRHKIRPYSKDHKKTALEIVRERRRKERKAQKERRNRKLDGSNGEEEEEEERVFENPYQIIRDCFTGDNPEGYFDFDKYYGFCELSGYVWETMKEEKQSYEDYEELENDVIDKLDKLADKGIHTLFIVSTEADIYFTWLRPGFELFLKDLLYYGGAMMRKVSKDQVRGKDTLIIWFGIDDEREGIKAGSNIKKGKNKIDSNELGLIKSRIISQVRDGHYKKAFNKILDDALYFTEHCDDCLSFWIGIGFFIVAGIVCLVLAIWWLVDCIRGRQLEPDEKKLVERFNNFLVAYKENQYALNKYCILCFKLLTEKSGMPENQKSDEDKKINDKENKSMVCGHSYHAECYEEWVLKDDDNCPICIEKLDGEDPQDKCMRKCHDVQSRLNPTYREVVFSIKNDELKYKFSSGFNSGDLEDED